MANTLRIKRRATGGASGAPTSLAQSELAWSEPDSILYIGNGSGGSATVIAIGGPGAYATKASPTFTGTPAAPTAASGTNTTQIATTAFVSAAVAAVDVSSQLTNYALKASPTFTGTPLAPTATAGTNSTQIATTAFVTSAVSSLVASAPAALDTLNELAAALGNDASFSTTVTTSIAAKLAKASNLSDLTDAATARSNLGLSSMATQSSSNVSITGGSIDNIDIDSGTF
jgi:phage-related tail fiber protein